MDKEQLSAFKNQLKDCLENELLPFWLDRCKDDRYGGHITHFDKDGNDTGEDEKSLIAQAAQFANLAAAVTVQKLFQTGTASGTEILEISKDAEYTAHD